jgi:hypothetical protein
MSARRDALLHLLEDAPISDAKRRKLVAEIRNAFIAEVDYRLVVQSLIENLNLVDFPFIDIWHFVQVVPEAIPFVWTDDHFRARTELEFNDVYRGSIEASGQMRERVKDGLVEMSSKSATSLYATLKEQVVPWALLYQRCKRMTVLSKQLDGKDLFTRIEEWPMFNTWVLSTLLPAQHMMDYRDGSGNGEYLAIPVRVVGGFEISHFIVANWYRAKRLGSRMLFGFYPGSKSVVLDMSQIVMHPTRVDSPRATNFVITQTGKVVYAVTHPNGYYLEVYDSLTQRRIPGEDADKIEKAVRFTMDEVDDNDDDAIELLEVINNSSVVKLELVEGLAKTIDIETYVEYLDGKRANVDFTCSVKTKFPTTPGFYLQNGWKFATTTPPEPEQPYLLPTKDGRPAVGALPVPAKGVNQAHGPFFSVSRDSPVLYAGFVGERYRAFLPGMQVSMLSGSWNFDESIQSSIFIVEPTSSPSFVVPQVRRLEVYHPAGFTVNIQFQDTFESGVDPQNLAIVGSDLLISYTDTTGELNSCRYYKIDLEELFMAHLDTFPALIRAPCRRCSLPSIAGCAGSACATPYCGIDCQKKDWEVHAAVCRAVTN